MSPRDPHFPSLAHGQHDRYPKYFWAISALTFVITLSQ